MFCRNFIRTTLFFIVFFFQGYTQEKNVTAPLKNILNDISQQHHVKFNYLEDEIALFALRIPDKKWSLKQKLEYISQSTGLIFKKITSTYYSIYNNQQLDKPLCGYLINKETQQPIENAFIRIQNSQVSTSSDANGYFELPKISSNTVEIIHQGYEIFRIEPQDLYVTDCPKFYLTAIIQELQEVLMPRYLTSGISKLKDGKIVITPKKFGLLPGLIEPDVLQTMLEIPGVLSIDETISNINVRGGTHDQNLFLWNDIRIFQTGHFFGLISAFNPSNSQKISITKNGSSAFYGESVSSLITIETNPSNADKNATSIGSNLISADFFKNINLSENASITVTGRRSLTDFFNSPTYKMYSKRMFQNTVITDLNSNETQNFENDINFYFYDLSLEYLQKIGTKNNFKIDFLGVENRLQFLQKNANLSKNSFVNQSNIGTSLAWETNWNATNTSKVTAYFSSYDLESVNETLENNQTLNQRNQVFDTGLKLFHGYKIDKNIVFNFGYQLNEIGVTNKDEVNEPVFSRTITKVLMTHSGILENEFESDSKKTFVRTGVRANYFDKFREWSFEPRLQASQQLNKHLFLELLAERKTQTLSQIIDLQQDFLGLEKRRWTLTDNDSIPIQKSAQVSLGLKYAQNKWLITVEQFYKNIDGITTDSQGFQNQLEFVYGNGSYSVFGTELFIQKTWGSFYSWISYTFNKNIYQFDTLNLPDFPNNLAIPHTVNWAGIFEWNRLKLALGAKWHTGRPITTPMNFEISEANPFIQYNKPNNERLDDYFQLNFSASKLWSLNSKTQLRTAVSVMNLLNTRNSINRFYRINYTTNSVESVDTYSLELTPNFSLKVIF